MERIKKGDYKIPDWTLEVTCSGQGWSNKSAPCYGIFKLDSNDIVKRKYHRYGECAGWAYGFICPDCHCFTEIDEKLIHHSIINYCKQVATKGSDAWNYLSDEEKEISEVL